MRTPAHLKENLPRLFLIRRWASHISVLFNGRPVYLVGSALVQANPRDWDFRVVMTADAFAWRYATLRQMRAMTSHELIAQFLREEMGEVPTTPFYDRWSHEMRKIGRDAFYRWTGLYTDFQVQPVRAARTWPGKPKWKASP
jgi:hypothetical protein